MKKKEKIVSIPVDGIMRLAEVPAVALPGVTRTSLKLPEDLTFAQWHSYAKYLRVIDHSHKWWLADLLIRADEWEHQALQALEDLDYPKHTLSNVKGVGTRFPVERRREELSFEHHSEVAYLPPEAADQLLEQAIMNRWNCKHLRDAAREMRAISAISNGSSAFLENATPTATKMPVCERREVAPNPEQNLDFLEQCQRSFDLALEFRALALTPIEDQIGDIMESAAILKDALIDLIEACERSGCQPL